LSYELLEQDEFGEVSSDALRQNGFSGLAEGELLTVGDLNQLALVGSSNDAAFAVAASVGAFLGPNEPAAQFVAGMNVRAEELGLSSMEFKNPTGLDVSTSEAGGMASAKDVSLLLSYMLQNYPELLEPTTYPTTRVYSAAGIYHDAENTNNVLYRIPNLIASKTGYTDLAGGNLTVAFDASFNRPVVITVLGSSRQERFTDVIALADAVMKDINTTE
jgi:D-alanyl-D-alanine carboxypeptidase (penicillin-binding protein 5/6)